MDPQMTLNISNKNFVDKSLGMLTKIKFNSRSKFLDKNRYETIERILIYASQQFKKPEKDLFKLIKRAYNGADNKGFLPHGYWYDEENLIREVKQGLLEARLIILHKIILNDENNEDFDEARFLSSLITDLLDEIGRYRNKNS